MEGHMQKDQELTSLLSRKIEAFEDFYAATILLETMLQEKNMAEIEAIINSRQTQIAGINMLDQEMEKLSGADSSFTGLGNKSVNDLMTKLGEVIRRVKATDEKCRTTTTAILKENSDGLLSLGKELNAFHGYDKSQRQKSRFLDVNT
jgi:hypothetical protein